MSNELVSIGREWNSPLIKTRVGADGVYVDMSVDAFQSAIEEELIKALPSLAWDMRSPTINEKVRAAFKTAFSGVVRRMKEETIKAV